MSAPFPIPESIADKPDWARKLWVLLMRSGYTSEAARSITLHALAHGTVQCAEPIEPEDLDAAEAVVPFDFAAWADPRWDRITATLTPSESLS